MEKSFTFVLLRFVDSHAIRPCFGTFDIAATFHLCTALTGLRRRLFNWMGMAAWQRGSTGNPAVSKAMGSNCD